MDKNDALFPAPPTNKRKIEIKYGEESIFLWYKQGK